MTITIAPIFLSIAALIVGCFLVKQLVIIYHAKEAADVRPVVVLTILLGFFLFLFSDSVAQGPVIAWCKKVVFEILSQTLGV